eukprot:TRINITY_DN3154_c0_g1_i18.p1 TRINITY_DN3154_c0_g1~~TRINITY_DN3154_c0_g1_i18.p1  ORF type:complete len:134 (-),score=26.65 TRINITY_DN3154_c0_g1_i18:108-509(-)
MVAIQKEKVVRAEENIALVRATMQAQKVAEVAVIEAQQAANVSLINAERQIQQKDAEKRKTDIDSQIQYLVKKTQTDSLFYQITKQAEANEHLHTESYLRAMLYESLSNNTIIYFGEKIPVFFPNHGSRLPPD